MMAPTRARVVTKAPQPHVAASGTTAAAPGAAATAVAGMITGQSRAPTVAPAAAPTTTGTTVLLAGLPGTGWAVAVTARMGAATSVDAITAALRWDFIRRLRD